MMRSLIFLCVFGVMGVAAHGRGPVAEPGWGQALVPTAVLAARLDDEDDDDGGSSFICSSGSVALLGLPLLGLWWAGPRRGR